MSTSQLASQLSNQLSLGAPHHLLLIAAPGSVVTSRDSPQTAQCKAMHLHQVSNRTHKLRFIIWRQSIAGD